MALRNILEQGHPSLELVCKPVKRIGDHERQINKINRIISAFSHIFSTI